MLCNTSPVWSNDYIDAENTASKTVEEIDDSLSYGFEEKRLRVLFLGEWIDNLPAFLSESSLTPHFRLYGFDRDRKIGPESEAITYGGEIRFISGLAANYFRIGTSFFTSQGIHDDNGENTLLLGENGSNINTLGTLYLDVDLDNAYLRFFRQTFNMPYLNRQDSRMIPNTHEAYVYASADKNFNFTVGHVSQIKQRNAESFISMAEAAGAEGSGKGMTMAGARYIFDNNLSVGAINYYTDDVLNIFYSEFTFVKKITNQISSRVTGQFTHQKSIGDDLIGEFDTNHYGIRLQTDYRNAILTLAATNTGEGAAIISPYGGRPGFLSLMLQNFDRANETGLLAGLSYDFSAVGLPGLSAFSNFAWGDNAKSAETGRSLPNVDEYNFTIDYRPQAGLLNGVWLRLRHARADFEGGNYTEDTRAILNYQLPVRF